MSLEKLVMRLLILFLASLLLAPAQSTTVFKAAPTNVTFAYTLGDPKLPAAQTVNLTGASTGTTFMVSMPTNAPWLAMSPLSGTTPVAAKVMVNPTSLAVGNYAATITVTGATDPPTTVILAVTLTVKSPPSTLTASPSTVNFTYTRGGQAVAPATLTLRTSGAVLPFSVAAAGGTWLSAEPQSGMAFPAFPEQIQVKVNPANLAPGSYKGTLNISSPQAVNKTQSVPVNLTVQPGTPALTALWPPRVTKGSPATTITVSGNNFYTGTLIKAGATTLAATFIGQSLMTAVVPANLLANSGTLSILASNPGAGGGDSPPLTFTVRDPGPVVEAVTNAASYTGNRIAPGLMLAIFGEGLGPADLTVFLPPQPGQTIATTLAGTRVLFDTTPGPVIYTSDRQVAVMAPYSLAGRSTVQVTVEYNGVVSQAKTFDVAASAPGIFSAAGTGTGQVAAFNYDEQTQGYSLNTEGSPVVKEGVVVFFATGEGVTTPQSQDGQMITAPSSTVNPALSVQIGGVDATVLYAGGVVGMVAGVLQLNVRVPQAVAAGKAVPVVLRINGIESQPGVTIAVK